MKAMILAAGYGSRLAPLTDTLPKALVPVHGKPMLEHLLDKLYTAGFREIVINTHHFSDQVEEFVKGYIRPELAIQLSFEENLLDTGGGIKMARNLLGDGPVLFHNVDILSNINLEELMVSHTESGNMATLAVQERETSRSLLFTTQGYLGGWAYPERFIRIITRNSRPGYLSIAFSGIYVLNSELFSFFPEEDEFSLTPWLIDLSKDQLIGAFDHTDSLWFDLGQTSKLKKAEKKVDILDGTPSKKNRK